MSVIVAGPSGASVETEPTHDSLRVTTRPMEITGAYAYSGLTGAMTTIAAGSATAGHVFALRWTSATHYFLLRYLRLRWQTTTAFTAAQELQFKAFRVSSYSASHSAGTAITAFPKKKTSQSASLIADARIATAAALTAGSQTFDAEAFFSLDGISQTAASPGMPAIESILDFTQAGEYPLVLAANEGIVIRNEILMGAAGVGKLTVEMQWLETPIANWPG